MERRVRIGAAGSGAGAGGSSTGGGGGSSSSSVKVCVRIRPQSDAEAQASGQIVVRAVDDHVLVFDPDEPEEPSFFHGKPLASRDPTQRKPRDLKFAFDRVFDERSTNLEVYEETTRDLLGALLSGYNCSVFAYGATGSGKTFTMLGKPSMPGVIFHTMMELYGAIEGRKTDAHYDVAISYMEVYNEQVKDLLISGSQCLPLREDPQRGVVVQGLSLHKPRTAEELLQMLEQGNRNRTQHPTDANAESSRSHAVFQVFVRQSDRGKGTQAAVNVGKMSLIDLAGSERATVSKNCGDRLREGANINRSLLALGNCINALADGQKRKGQQHVPYRDSKLTRILKDSLGGNCCTVMIAAVSPSRRSFDDTYNTLRYADRAKHIKAEVRQNVVNVDQHILRYTKIIDDLTAKVTLLESRLKKADEDRSAAAAASLAGTTVARALTMPAAPDCTIRCKEALQPVFSERAAVRNAMLSAESHQRLAQYAILRKETALSRLLALEDQTNAGETPESASRMQQSIALTRQREAALAQEKRLAGSKVKANVERLRQVLASNVAGSQQDKGIREHLQELLSNEHLKCALVDSRQHVKHLRRLTRLLDKENVANDRLISALLRAVKQQATVLEKHGLFAVELREPLDGVREMLGSDRSVGFADEPELADPGDAEVSEPGGVGVRESFADLTGLPTYQWPLSLPAHCPLSAAADPGDTSPSSIATSHRRTKRSPALKRGVPSRYGDDGSDSVASAASWEDDVVHRTDGIGAPAATAAAAASSVQLRVPSAKNSPVVGDATHATKLLSGKGGQSPMDIGDWSIAQGRTVSSADGGFSWDSMSAEPFVAPLNETFCLDNPLHGRVSAAEVTAAGSESGTLLLALARPMPATAAAAAALGNSRVQQATAAIATNDARELRSSAVRLPRPAQGDSCSSALQRGTSTTAAPLLRHQVAAARLLVAADSSAPAAGAEGTPSNVHPSHRVAPRRTALGTCNTPPLGVSAATFKKAMAVVSAIHAARDGLSGEPRSPTAHAPVALLRGRGDEENAASGAVGASRPPLKRTHVAADTRPNYMQMTHSASFKKARLDSAAGRTAAAAMTANSTARPQTDSGGSGLPRALLR